MHLLIIWSLLKTLTVSNPIVYQVGLNEYPNPTDGPYNLTTSTV